MVGQSALIFGATGATGKHVLRELLSSDKFTRVGEYGRHVSSTDELPNKEKLEQKVVDFENLDAAAIKRGRWDVIFITLGTNRAAAGSAEAFERIDRHYVLNAAQAAKSDSPDHNQRLVYLSSIGANSASHFLYPRSKGLTEDGLAAMGYDLIVFRPAYLAQAERPNFRLAETIFQPILSFMSFFTSSAQIPVSVLAKSIRKAGELGGSGIPEGLRTTESRSGLSFALLDNRQALALADLA